MEPLEGVHGPQVQNICNGEICEICEKRKLMDFFFLLTQLIKNSDTFVVRGIVGLLSADPCSTLEQIVLGMIG